mgnify:CR=1 FL=1
MPGHPDAGNVDRREQLRRLIGCAREQAERLEVSHGDPLHAAPVELLREVPGYAVEEEIYRGGQGAVYKARQLSTGRAVAVKVMRDGQLATARDAARFEREIHILGRLNHPNIVGVVDSGTLGGGTAYFVMDYVQGEPLDRVAEGLPTEQRLRLFAKVCDAVHAAHLRGVIHRDLKPSNILVDATGEPHVLDFGLAKLDVACDRSSAASEMTATGQFVGSLPWASPEQAAGGSDPIDIRTDVYSLGVMLYRILVGRFPYSVVGNLRDVLDRILTTAPPAPSTMRRGLDDEIDTLVLKCLAKERERRYDSAGELARDLRHYLADEPIEAKRDSAWYVLRKTIMRYRGRAAALAAFCLLSTASAIAFAILYNQQTVLLEQRDAAVRRAQTELDASRQIAQFTEGMLSGIDPAIAGNLDTRLVRLMLDRAAARLEQETIINPEVEGAVRGTVGRAYLAIGDLAAAEAHLRRALELRQAVFGEDSGRTLSCMCNLGHLYLDLGRYAEAERLLEASLAGERRILGPEHIVTLATASKLALLYDRQGRLAEADALCRQTLDSRISLLGPEHPHALASITHLAGLRMQQGEPDAAAAVYEQVLDAQRRVQGPQHPHTLSLMNNLATAYHLQGRRVEAAAIQREAVDLSRIVMGEFHPSTLQFQITLAAMDAESGRVAEARALLQDTHATARRVLGDRHPLCVDALYHLASLLLAAQDFETSAERYREVLAILESSAAPSDPRLALARLGLGAALMPQQCFQEAESLLLAGHAGVAGGPDSGRGHEQHAVAQLVRLYEAWDAAEPGTGRDQAAQAWRDRLAHPPQSPAAAPP